MLDEYPRSIENALAKAGLGWKITHGDVLVVKTPEWTDDFGTKHPPELIPAKGFKANVREDTGAVLGLVSDECTRSASSQTSTSPGRRNSPSAAELDALLAAPSRETWTGRRDHAIILLAAQTGLRASELTSLKIRDVSLGTGAHVATIGKGRCERITPLTDKTVTTLRVG
jgi:integrase